MDSDAQSEMEAEEGKKAAKIAMAGNGAISIIKLAVGTMFGSMAVMADGIDSFFDIVSSASVMIGIRASEKPPDVEHLYGHGRYENLPSLIIAGSLILAAMVITIEAARRIAYNEHRILEWIVLGAALLSIAFKYQLQKFLFKVAERIGSMSLKSYAQNIRGDVLTSISVAIGVTTTSLGLPWADPLAAIIVAAFIFKTGIGVATETLQVLVDRSPGIDAISQIRSSALSVPGIKDCHKVRARRSGRNLLVDLHVEIDPGMDVLTSHGISDRVVGTILKEVPDVESVLVHIEPGPAKEDKENHSKEIEAIRSEVVGVKGVIECHEIGLRHIGEDMIAEMHILVDPSLNITETHKISEEVTRVVKSYFKKVKQVIVHEEPVGHAHDEG